MRQNGIQFYRQEETVQTAVSFFVPQIDRPFRQPVQLARSFDKLAPPAALRRGIFIDSRGEMGI